jgi:hypothetical protein
MLTLITLTFHFQTEVVFGITQQKTTELHTDPHNTKLEGYRHLQLQTATASSHSLHYDVTWVC